MKIIFPILLVSVLLISHIVAPETESNDFSLSNAFLYLQFHTPQEGGGLRSIKNESGFEFINRYSDKSLWQIELRRIPQKEADKDSIFRWNYDIETMDGMPKRSPDRNISDVIRIKSDAVSATLKAEKNQAGLTMSWQGIDVGKEKAVLDVSVTVKLSEDDRFARFKANFSNRSKVYTVFYLTAPVFNGIYPSDGKTDLDWLASPVFNGRLMRNPIKNGILGKPYYFQPNRSGHSMQFDAYYHNDNGLYFGCFDEMQNVKRYYLAADAKKGLSWGMVHVPDNMKTVPQIWTTPYDTVLRCYKGDWYDACRIYREWALKQSWAAEGPLYKRTSTPRWFKEIDVWLMWHALQLPKNNPYDKEITESFLGLTKGVKLYNWGKGHHIAKMNPDWFPLDEQSLDSINRAKQNNHKLIGFIQSICWDRQTESFKKLNGVDYTVRNFRNERIVWDLDKERGPAKHHIDAIAYPGKIWGEVLGNAILKMARVGFDAAYLDSFNHGGTYMNFNPNYNTQFGGGNTYIKDNQKMLRNIKEQVRKINPEFSFSSESFWEGNMAVVDGFLTCNTTGRPLKKDTIFAIPMIQSVYHDYALCLGAFRSRWDIETDDGLSYTAKNAQAFVWGVKSAWNQPFYLSRHKDSPRTLDVVSKRSHAYAAARKFLVYGEMLREPKPAIPVPEMNMKWYINWSKNHYNISMPAVLCSAWRAPDGNLGVVLYNISSEKQNISLILDDPGYGINKSTKGRIKSLYPVESQTSDWETLDKTIVLSCTVPARSPMVFEIELQEKSS